jgi:hypothetical protein
LVHFITREHHRTFTIELSWAPLQAYGILVERTKNMIKIRQTLFSLVFGGISLMSATLSAQCTKVSVYYTAIAPVPAATLVAVSCNYAGEHCTVNLVVSGSPYSTAITVAPDDFSVRSVFYYKFTM